jgi:hypothetical protein
LVPRSVDLDLEILVNVHYGRAISIKKLLAALRKRSGRGTEQFSDSEIVSRRQIQLAGTIFGS